MKRISKTILILAICAWTGNGTSLLNASNSHRITRAELEMQQHRPRPNRPMSREHVMNDKDFQYLYKTIKKKSFDRDRLELLSVGYWTIISVADNVQKSFRSIPSMMTS